MKKNLLSLMCLLVVGVALMAGGVGLVYAQTGVLDGKSFQGEFGKKGKAAHAQDELIFKDGRFRSTACDPYEFGDAPYTTKVEGDSIAFEAETVSAKNGKIKWMGTVKGNKIEAAFTWFSSGNPPEESWLKGELKK
jgi:hypothetical protein